LSGPSKRGAPVSRRTWRAARAVTAVAAVCAVGVVEVAPAAAAPGYVFAGAFGDQGGDDGQFTSPRAVAVAANGDVLVADRDNDRVQVFTPDAGGATYADQFGAGVVDDPSGLAVDPSDGSIYVSDADAVVKFTSGHTPDATFAPLATHGQLAVDPVTDDLLVANPDTNAVERYASDGTPIATGVPAGPFSALGAIAVDGTGAILLVDGTTVRRFTAAGEPDGALDGLTEPNALAVNADDQVVVGDSNDSYSSDVIPAVRFYDAGATAPRASYTLPEGKWGQIAGAAIGPGHGGRLYVLSDKDQGFGVVRVFAYDETVPVAPVVSAPGVTGVTADAAVLGATVNPGLAATTFHFEYGTDAGYGSRTPDRSAGDGGTETRIGELVNGLRPDTLYHFRVVVDNGIGPAVVGADATFTTGPAAPAIGGASASVDGTGVTVHATVDTRGHAGRYTVSVASVDSAYASSVGPIAIDARDGAQAVTAVLSGLPAGERFLAQVTASTVGGDRAGERVAFSTPARPGFTAPGPLPGGGAVPWGCAAPSLRAPQGTVTAGRSVTLSGSDLGLVGSVAVDGALVATTAYSANAITFVVPDDARGTVGVQVDCGHQSEAVAMKVAAPKPSNSLSATARLRGTTITVSAKVGSAGTVTVSGGTSLATRRADAAKAGTVTVRAPLSAAGRKALRRHGRAATVHIRVRFAPVGGTPSTRKLNVTLNRGADR